MKRAWDGLAAWMLIGIIAWGGLLLIGLQLWNHQPPRAGFDLALLLDGARSIGAGHSPYDPAMLAGGSPSATELFYSYPPPVAQALRVAAWLPDGIVLILWAVGATLGLGLIAHQVAQRTGEDRRETRRIALKAILVAPLFLPFAVALLFGNLDAWYPLLYGALLLAIYPTSGRGTWIWAGIAVAIVTIAKLHPAVLGLWILVRFLTDRERPWRIVLLAAIAAGVAILAASLVIGGVQPWLDYATVVRAGAGASLVDARNLGPVSLLAQATGAQGSMLTATQAVVSVVAAVVTILAAWRVRDPVASLAVAFSASLVVLPVTWYHYPVALVPIGLALAIARPPTRLLVAVAIVVADVAVGVPALLWVAVAILLVAAFRSSRLDPAHAQAAVAAA